ncbi:MAG: hypothetical protein GF350_14125 [Chitinivibrionales bacterium]|nr:hypothetical protein [Chitinivibrionales bacterium]
MTGTTVQENRQEHSFVISVKPCVTYRHPVYELADEWDSYYTFGIATDVPTLARNFAFRIELEAGTIESKSIDSFEYTIFHPSLSLVYEFSVISNRIFILPRIGVTSTTIHIEDETIFRNMDLMATWESEFGALAGVEPCFRYRKFEATIPVSLAWTFSSPEPFVFIAVSISAGMRF